VSLILPEQFDLLNSVHTGSGRDFLDRRVTDGVIRQMIDKWLKAGVLKGATPTNASCVPMFAMRPTSGRSPDGPSVVASRPCCGAIGLAVSNIALPTTVVSDRFFFGGAPGENVAMREQLSTQTVLLGLAYRFGGPVFAAF
jgi:hypothetical protein